jgi:hypothetical protein
MWYFLLSFGQILADQQCSIIGPLYPAPGVRLGRLYDT